MAREGATSDRAPQPDGPRPRGRPRRHIDMEAVAEAVGELFAEGGYEAVSITNTAEKLGVSRATLYRTVPTREHLLGVLVEQGLSELAAATEELIQVEGSAREQLHNLVRLQVTAAVRIRSYMSVLFFGGVGLPPEVFKGWRAWSRRYETAWIRAVERAMAAGVLRKGDPRITARLLLGMVIWVARWYRPTEGITPDDIAKHAINLLYSSAGVDTAQRESTPGRRRSPLRARA